MGGWTGARRRRLRGALAASSVGALLVVGAPLTAAPASGPAGPAPSSASAVRPAYAARAALAGQVAGFEGVDVAGLRTVSVARSPAGEHLVRFQQTYDGVPVLGGQLVAAVDGGGALTGVTGEVTLGRVSAAYVVPASTAARTAVRAAARRLGTDPRALRVDRPTRAYLDASLLSPGGAPGARPVWSVLVTAPADLTVRRRVLVDAENGRVALQVSEAPAAVDRVVCDNANVPGDYRCRPGRYARVEGQAPSGIPDVDSAYDLTGSTADWFSNHLAVDLTALIGTDLGDGPKLRSTTRYCGSDLCPEPNAFWTGDQMVYGEGYAAADDVVAHELAHGVSQKVAGLVYWYQSGAISESISDVFGELVDLGNGIGTDTDTARWSLGEDLPLAAGGIARNMSRPPDHGQPDATDSPLYDGGDDYEDSGGVHTNSGVPNKAAYLITDGTVAEPGGAFRGQSFAGIGPDKAAVLYWSALHLLTPGSDFADLGRALSSSCVTLANAGAAGFVPADCTVVEAAVSLTGLMAWAGPTEPRSLRTSTGVGSVRLRWEPPAYEGSAPVSSYVVWVRPAPRPQDEFVLLEPWAEEHDVRGLRPGVAYTVGLVAVSAAGTSDSVVRSFTGSALEARWPDAVTFGQRLKLRGELRGADGQALGDRPVTLLRRARAGAQYELLDRTRTSLAGRFVLEVRPRRTAQYVVLFDGDVGVVGSRTSPNPVAVRQAVRIGTSAGLRAGLPPVVTGSVAPARKGAAVTLQRSVRGGTWETVAVDRLDAAGRFRLRPRRPSVPDSRWRVSVAASPNGALAAGVSRVLTGGDAAGAD